jgi:uncharacterized membrane protein
VNIKLLKLWDSLNSSYWFLPTLMAALAIALAFGMLTLDRAARSSPFAQLGWIYTGGPDGARTMLSAIAGSMITVAGTVFSITIVALQLASSQFGPRLLRNFMQDTGNQVVLGTFIATFIYCLLVLRTIRSGDTEFVPQLSVTLGILLAIVSIGVLIYFIHHASTLIQASNVIKQASDDLSDAVDRLFPHEIGHGLPESRHQVGEIPIGFDTEAVPVKSTGSGYLQAVDEQRLMKIAKSKDLLLRLVHRPGQFIVHGSELTMVWPGERVNQQLSHQINQAFVLGRERTEQQDIEFSINQLVEIAIRAISPSINDPFTAIRCIDQLSVGLSRLAEREFPSPYRYDDNNNLRVIADPVSFTKLTDAAFNKIRQYGTSDVSVILRLLEAITVIAKHARRQKDRAALLRHAQMIERGSLEAVSEELDRKEIKARYWTAVKALEQ